MLYAFKKLGCLSFFIVQQQQDSLTKYLYISGTKWYSASTVEMWLFQLVETYIVDIFFIFTYIKLVGCTEGFLDKNIILFRHCFNILVKKYKFLANNMLKN